MPVFIHSIIFKTPCSFGNVTVQTADDLEALRYCSVLDGSLTIAITDLTADYSALYDIATIQGLDC